MKRLLVFAAALVMVVGIAALSPRLKPGLAPSREAPMSVGTEDDPNAQAEMEFLMLRDPRTNEIPRRIRKLEMLFARNLPTRRELNNQARAQGGPPLEILEWIERGPNNVGGRTRAFAIDVASSTTLLAGSVGGGIWKTVNDGASWSLRTAPAQIHGTTCIAQDKRAGKTNVWYVGTGEIRGSTTNQTRWGSLYLGDGIFKSTNNGDSWTLLPSTSTGTPQTADPFDFVINVATSPTAPIAEEHVYAATFRGVYRSINGGGSWTLAQLSDSGFTDVAVTSTGVVYAFTRVPQPRIWRSPDGVTWTNILPAAGFPTSVNRIVIALCPSNPNAVYFFAQGANNTPAVATHQIWKYTYVSGNGSGAGGTWVNRGGNLPSDINTQTGYDQLIQVKPNDENFVIIGGTNLYRSTNGFATNATNTVIGGYPFYPDGLSHPDFHSGAFSPTQPNVFYAADDGGIQKAADITLTDMLWTWLNNGYNVTQFYSVTIAPEAGSNLIMAGAQDNGTQLGDAPGASDWLHVFGGDGTIVKIAPIADDRLYTQYQGGQMQRQTRSYADVIFINPSGATNQLFVNPIVLDPNNSHLLYYAGGIAANTSRIWRNDNAPEATDIDGWSNLAATEVGAGLGYNRQITAIGISTAGNPNVLYYGTGDGMVFRADNAHTATPTVTNVTPPGLNGGSITGGFVRCIAVDPTNSNQAIVTFGNYNFQSIWYTTNGGANWTDIEGNLAGPAGPSVRWAQMFYVDGQLQVFLGTSIGVLSTTALAGGSTVWAQEATETIGNVIVGYMDYRDSDRTLAIGTHARGVFTGTFTTPVAVEPTGRRTGVALAQSAPNPTQREATIAFDLERPGQVSLKVYDVHGREVATLVNGHRERGRHQERFTAGRLAGGVYYYVLRASGETLTRKLVLAK
ncbi:MAG TPA: T9SS type A sorting domain-containing protein [Candidatus Eisenbacteria bacterium]|nr:T9SS type A sorting domain-containing protein [Candidatus Eisenbacteria bacterium]